MTIAAFVLALVGWYFAAALWLGLYPWSVLHTLRGFYLAVRWLRREVVKVRGVSTGAGDRALVLSVDSSGELHCIEDASWDDAHNFDCSAFYYEPVGPFWRRWTGDIIAWCERSRDP